jgi:hypothetical protein
LSVDAFWALTPSEFNGFSAVFAKKREAEIELMKAAAYWSESLARTKRLPDFDKWLNPPKPARVLKGKEAEKRLQEHEEDVAMIERLMEEKKKEELTDG